MSIQVKDSLITSHISTNTQRLGESVELRMHNGKLYAYGVGSGNAVGLVGADFVVDALPTDFHEANMGANGSLTADVIEVLATYDGLSVDDFTQSVQDDFEAGVLSSLSFAAIVDVLSVQPGSLIIEYQIIPVSGVSLADIEAAKDNTPPAVNGTSVSSVSTKVENKMVVPKISEVIVTEGAPVGETQYGTFQAHPEHGDNDTGNLSAAGRNPLLKLTNGDLIYTVRSKNESNIRIYRLNADSTSTVLLNVPVSTYFADDYGLSYVLDMREHNGFLYVLAGVGTTPGSWLLKVSLVDYSHEMVWNESKETLLSTHGNTGSARLLITEHNGVPYALMTFYYYPSTGPSSNYRRVNLATNTDEGWAMQVIQDHYTELLDGDLNPNSFGETLEIGEFNDYIYTVARTTAVGTGTYGQSDYTTHASIRLFRTPKAKVLTENSTDSYSDLELVHDFPRTSRTKPGVTYNHSFIEAQGTMYEGVSNHFQFDSGILYIRDAFGSPHFDAEFLKFNLTTLERTSIFTLTKNTYGVPLTSGDVKVPMYYVNSGVIYYAKDFPSWWTHIGAKLMVYSPATDSTVQIVKTPGAYDSITYTIDDGPAKTESESFTGGSVLKAFLKDVNGKVLHELTKDISG